MVELRKNGWYIWLRGKHLPYTGPACPEFVNLLLRSLYVVFKLLYTIPDRLRVDSVKLNYASNAPDLPVCSSVAVTGFLNIPEQVSGF